MHVAFPAPSKDAVKTFFISALKAGGQIHGEPKTRDSQSGYYSAAIVDFDGNSIEAVFRPGASVVASEAGGPTIALLENGSVVSKSSKATTVSKATTTKKAESVAPAASEAPSRAVSRAPTAVEKAAPSVVSHHTQSQSRSIPQPTYTVQTQTVQKSDDGKAAKTIVGTLIGAAAGAAIAYAMVKGDSQSTESETDNKSQAPSQFVPNAFAQLMAPSQAPQEEQQNQQFRAIEAPPPRSVYTSASASGPRSTLSRSVTSKNPRASTVYEGTEFFDENGRRASDGSIFSIPEDIPLRAIEYPPQGNNSQRYPCSPSTFISSYAADKPRARSLAGPGSTHSVSTIKASQTQSISRRHSHDDRASYTSSHHSQTYHATSTHSHQSGAGTANKQSPPKSSAGSVASSTRSARNIPLPAGSQATYYSAAPSQSKSHVSAREVPLPESVIDLDVNSNVTPDDSISQVGSRSGRSHHSHRSHRSHSKGGSKASKNSHAHSHSSKSKFEIPVIPADSVSQASSQRTVKAAGSRAHSQAGSRRGSQVV